MSTVIDKINKEQLKPVLPNLEVGDAVKVHVAIIEGAKERIQVFAGTIIAMNGSDITKTITVRRVVSGMGVERVFPVHSPNVRKVSIENKHKVRRAKLYYLRGRSGKAARLKPRDFR